MITTYIAVWKAALHSKDENYLASLLADDVVFHSPAVHSPQKGKALALKYLNAAKIVLNNENFTYLNEWVNETSAILEFSTMLDGILVNGIDMITWDDSGKIIDFKVMMRPLKGINAVIPLMAAELYKH